MAFDEQLAARIRAVIGEQQGFSEKKMFGGVGFLLDGNMCVGIWQQSLIARIGPVAYKSAIGEPHVKEFDITGRPMKGWVLVAAEGIASDEQLEEWIARASAFVRKLPAK